MATIDLNSDLGESVDGVPTADDEAMFPLISSASIACGGHAGDAASMRDAVDRAARFAVAIGAHPSYPDRAHFGRVAMVMDAGDLGAALDVQLKALVGADIRYVKPHGALYNAVVDDSALARVVADAVARFSERLGRALPILGLGGEIQTAARAASLPFVREAFLDRGYESDGTLVARTAPGAVLQHPDAVAERAIRLARSQTLMAVDGTVIDIDAASLCLHGDTPAAVAMARGVRSALDAEGVGIVAPW